MDREQMQQAAALLEGLEFGGFDDARADAQWITIPGVTLPLDQTVTLIPATVRVSEWDGPGCRALPLCLVVITPADGRVNLADPDAALRLAMSARDLCCRVYGAAPHTFTFACDAQGASGAITDGAPVLIPAVPRSTRQEVASSVCAILLCAVEKEANQEETDLDAEQELTPAPRRKSIWRRLRN